MKGSNIAVACFNGARFWILSSAFALLLLQVVRAPATPAKVPDSVKRLASIRYAIQAYETRNAGLLPRVTTDEVGNPLHSWRTLILPYLDRHELLDRCELREPWNSPRNCFLADEEIPLFHCLLDQGGSPRDTSFVAIGGAGTFWDRKKRRQRTNFTPATTILLIEIKGSGIQWAEPRDLDLDSLPQGVTNVNLLHWLAGKERGFQALFADGHIEFIDAEMSCEKFVAMLVPPDKQ